MIDKGFVAIFEVPTTNIYKILIKDWDTDIAASAFIFTERLSQYNVFPSIEEAKKSAIELIGEPTENGINYNAFDVYIYDLTSRKDILKKNSFSKEWKSLEEESL